MNLSKAIPHTLSLRLSLMMVLVIAMLLTGVMGVMFHFSRKVLREEAMHSAENTLQATAQHIDNILLSVEQGAGNYYWDVLRHLDQPELMEDYCRELVKSNRYVAGCAIAFEPGYYAGRDEFMAYVRRNLIEGDWLHGRDTLETPQSFHNESYTKQAWYSQPLKTQRTYGMEPLKDGPIDDALITFSLPIFDSSKGTDAEGKMKCVGVMGVDVPIRLLSDFILATKPSPNGYTMLLGQKGTYIVHPDAEKLYHQTIFTQLEHGADPSIREIGNAMVNGESGFKAIKLDGNLWYVVFQPLTRADVPGRVTDYLNWSVGVVYPDNDIFSAHRQLLYYLLAIAIIGLATFFLLCRVYAHRKLLPLAQLTYAAQRIAEGDYDATVPQATHDDEIGQLQNHFLKMQRALSVHMSEQNRLSAQLQERNEVLQRAYRQAQEADRTKTSFLHAMTNQMVSPADAILDSVNDDPVHTADVIQQQTKVIIDILDHMLKEAGKEGAHA